MKKANADIQKYLSQSAAGSSSGAVSGSQNEALNQAQATALDAANKEGIGAAQLASDLEKLKKHEAILHQAQPPSPDVAADFETRRTKELTPLTSVEDKLTKLSAEAQSKAATLANTADQINKTKSGLGSNSPTPAPTGGSQNSGISSGGGNDGGGVGGPGPLAAPTLGLGSQLLAKATSDNGNSTDPASTPPVLGSNGATGTQAPAGQDPTAAPNPNDPTKANTGASMAPGNSLKDTLRDRLSNSGSSISSNTSGGTSPTGSGVNGNMGPLGSKGVDGSAANAASTATGDTDPAAPKDLSLDLASSDTDSAVKDTMNHMKNMFHLGSSDSGSASVGDRHGNGGPEGSARGLAAIRGQREVLANAEDDLFRLVKRKYVDALQKGLVLGPAVQYSR